LSSATIASLYRFWSRWTRAARIRAWSAFELNEYFSMALSSS